MNLSTARNTAMRGMESARANCLLHANLSRQSVAIGNATEEQTNMTASNLYFGDMMTWANRLGGMGLSDFAQDLLTSADAILDGIVGDIVRMRREGLRNQGEEAANV